MEFYEQIGKNVRHQLIEHGMTQAKLARKLGVTQSYMSDILNGRRKIKLEMLIKIADEFEVSLDSLCPSEKQAVG